MKARDDGSTSVSSAGSVARSTQDVLDKEQESKSPKRLRTIPISEEDMPQIEEIKKLIFSHNYKPSSAEEKRIIFAHMPQKITISKHKSARRGSMEDQGLKMGSTVFDDKEEKRFNIPFEDRIVEQDSVEFEGRKFQKNTCFRVAKDKLNAETNKDGEFVIEHFLHDENGNISSALCYEIIDFELTALETVQPTSKMENFGLEFVDRFMIRAGSKREIPLDNLGEEVEGFEKPPDGIYIERQASSSLLFGLVDNRKKPTRNGLRKSPIKGIDFFAGAGLASRGFEASCCKIVASIEKNEDAVQSYARIHNATVSEVASDDWESILNIENGRVAFHGTAEAFLLKYENTPALQKALGCIDIAILCPPCQGFSKANVGKQGNAEENNNESLRILTVAELMRPKVLVFENVDGLWTRVEIKNYLQKIVYGLVNLGYNVQVGCLCAASFGDPQARPRLILIASRSDIGLPVYPRPTHGHPFQGDDEGGGLLPYVTARDALKPEEDKHPERDETLSLDHKEENRRNPNKPAPTVMASKSNPHYSKNRLYSLTENAILMGQGGSEYVAKLVGDKASKQRQIGNGVPMEMACAIGRAVHGVLKWDWECAEEPKYEDVDNSVLLEDIDDVKIGDLLSEVSDSREKLGEPISNDEGSGEEIGDLLSESEDIGMDIHDLLSEPEDDNGVDSEAGHNDALNLDEKLSNAFLSNGH